MTAMFVFAVAGTAQAVSTDITKSDITITAQTSDLSSAQISISVEWQSNFTSTSQYKSNVRAMTEMAVIEEIGKHKASDLEKDKSSIEDNIKLILQDKTQNFNLSITDVLVTKITLKDQSPDANKPKIIEKPYIPTWIYLLSIAAFAIGYFLGKGNEKK